MTSMSRNANRSFGRFGSFFVLFILCLLYSLPNFYGEDLAVQVARQDHSPVSNETYNTVATLLKAQALQPDRLDNEDANGLLARYHDPKKQLEARDFLKQNLGDAFSVALNLAPKTPTWLQTIGALPMKLGLDLRGGVHFLLHVDTSGIQAGKAKSDLLFIKKELQKEDIRYRGGHSEEGGSWYLSFSAKEEAQKAQSLLATRWQEYGIKLEGSAGHYKLVATPTPQSLQTLISHTIEQNITTLNQRINELGVSEAVVARHGNEHISVDLPGIQDTARAKALLGKTATLRFHLVDVTHDPKRAAEVGPPMGSQLYYYRDRPMLLETRSILTGRSITYATATNREGRPAVGIQLGGGGESLFHRETAANVGRPLAVVYIETQLKREKVGDKWVTHHQRHEKVISVATIQSALPGHFEITGLGSQAGAENLALLLRSGALAAPVNIVQETTIGPTLGQANIQKGINSLLIGSLAVIVFMALYYRVFGMIANVALILNVLLIVSAMSLIGATLTLSGIAGIVLTVGMAVDANVLINERIREELRRGLSPTASIEAGYKRAFSTIVDANVTTLIVAVVLFTLGSGTVKGFAITLMIGIVASMITSIYFTRALVDTIYPPGRRLQRIAIGIQPQKKLLKARS